MHVSPCLASFFFSLKNLLSLLTYLDNLVENLRTLTVKVVWNLCCSVWLCFYISNCMSLPCCFNQYSSVANFTIEKCGSSNFVLLLVTQAPCIFIGILRLACLISAKNLALVLMVNIYWTILSNSVCENGISFRLVSPFSFLLSWGLAMLPSNCCSQVVFLLSASW